MVLVSYKISLLKATLRLEVHDDDYDDEDDNDDVDDNINNNGIFRCYHFTLIAKYERKRALPLERSRPFC